jgi:N-sulfoglucosamine sulfohydrolase
MMDRIAGNEGIFGPGRRLWRWPALLAAVAVGFASVAPTAAAGPLNILLITLDDMNWDSIGVNGCKVPNVSPNIDRLASQGMLFNRAHVTIAVCQPTRAVWMTGLYPFHNGARGFERISPDVKTTLPEELKRGGYFTGLMAKAPHVVPSRHAAFDVIVPANQLGVGRNPELYYEHAKAFFAQAKSEGKPFFLMANSQDPHRPFAGSPQEGGRRRNPNAKAKNPGASIPPVTDPYRPEQVVVPGFLPDLPAVRLEMSEYFTSVRRADAITGRVLRALHEAGYDDSTLVLFLSDHGMPLPFAKTNCYYNSTRTPLIVRWPGVVKAGAVDDSHFVSGIDMTPTILDAAGLPPIDGDDGRSFVPLLRGEDQDGRDRLYTCFHKTAGGNTYEMRALHDERFVYIFNPWSDGKTVFRNESQAGRTMKAMVAAAKDDPAVAARVKLFLYRVPQELYDWRKDPDALHNLADDPAFAKDLKRLRGEMRQKMKELSDPLLPQLIAKTGP